MAYELHEGDIAVLDGNLGLRAIPDAKSFLVDPATQDVVVVTTSGNEMRFAPDTAIGRVTYDSGLGWRGPSGMRFIRPTEGGE